MPLPLPTGSCLPFDWMTPHAFHWLCAHSTCTTHAFSSHPQLDRKHAQQPEPQITAWLWSHLNLGLSMGKPRLVWLFVPTHILAQPCWVSWTPDPSHPRCASSHHCWSLAGQVCFSKANLEFYGHRFLRAKVNKSFSLQFSSPVLYPTHARVFLLKTFSEDSWVFHSYCWDLVKQSMFKFNCVTI